ncbi:MAG TPA: O-methyltransferase [Terracidiphilus sp.]|jgi:predicted O-methyltransferase YrrM
MQEMWAAVDRYFGELLAPEDQALTASMEANRKAGLPSIDVPALLGKFLELMVRISGARRVLEIGTLGAYSTIWLARALPAGGRVVTLEIDPHHASIARANLKAAGVLERVEVRVGPANEILRAMHERGEAPFDVIFIDADKKSLPDYLDWSLKLSRPGSVIVADNVVRDGQVLDAGSADPDVQGVRRMTEMMASNPRLSATAIPTVGARGYDGFAVAVVLP